MHTRGLVVVSAVVAWFGFVGEAGAQTSELLDTCSAFYANAMANVREEYREDLQFKDLHSRMCSGKTVRSNFSLTSSAEVALKAFPFKGTGNIGSSKERQELFCSEYDETSFDSSKAYAYERIIVTQSQENFNLCIKPTSAVLISHTYSDGGKLDITIKVKQSDFPVKLLNFSPSDDLTCVSPQLSGLISSGTVVRGKEYEFDSDIVISCERRRMKTDLGDKYGRSSVILSVNRTDDQYKVTLPEDVVLAPILASESASRIEALTSALTEAEKEQAQLTERIGGLEAQVGNYDAYSVVLHHGAGNPFQQFGLLGGASNVFVGYPNPYLFTTNCPKNGIQLNAGLGAACRSGYSAARSEVFYDHDGAPCGHTYRVVTCVRK